MNTSRAGLLQFLSIRGVKQGSSIAVISDEAAEYYWRALRWQGSTEASVEGELADWCRQAGARFAQGWAQ